MSNNLDIKKTTDKVKNIKDTKKRDAILKSIKSKTNKDVLK